MRCLCWLAHVCCAVCRAVLCCVMQAYDAFGCQHQLYYRGKGKGQMWYEPVFRVTTLEGQEVWRNRR